MAVVDSLGASLERIPGGGVVLTTIDTLMDWSRGQSLWAFPMATACCAMELIAASFSKFDFDRLGTFPRSDPRHCDVMVLAGTITKKMQPAVKRLYEQMPEPKYVVAMGNCVVSGGIFYHDSYSAVRGADAFLPVDVYICGCPPRPESLEDGVLQLRELVKQRSIAAGRTYPRETLLPGPDAPLAGTTDPAESRAIPVVPPSIGPAAPPADAEPEDLPAAAAPDATGEGATPDESAASAEDGEEQ